MRAITKAKETIIRDFICFDNCALNDSTEASLQGRNEQISILVLGGLAMLSICHVTDGLPMQSWIGLAMLSICHVTDGLPMQWCIGVILNFVIE